MSGKRPFDKHNQLCWDCEKACGGCSWSKDFIPVPGWKAIPTKLKGDHYSAKDKQLIDSFDIYECPEFEPLNFKNKKELVKLFERNIGRIRGCQE